MVTGRSWARSRWVDIAILAVYLASLGVMGWYVRDVNSRALSQVCNRVEEMKAQLVIDKQAADARLDSLADELGPGVISAGHELNAKTIERFAPKRCPKP